jgi:hypothetical protein
MRGNLRGQARQIGRLIERLPPPEAAPALPLLQGLSLSADTLRALLTAMRAFSAKYAGGDPGVRVTLVQLKEFLPEVVYEEIAAAFENAKQG